MEFGEFVAAATNGRVTEPYPYQRRLVDEGLPEVLGVPTGAGKTMAATLGWLYRRREHPDADVRAQTPHWLVFTLPMRVLVEQAHVQIAGWLDGLGLTDQVGLYGVMGGEGRRDALWRYQPEQDAIFVGTLDMLISRALNRGYGESRWSWPIDFGLFNAGTQWVFDEVQLMGPALPTSRQLDALRIQFGLAADSRSMWMSATVDEQRLRTVDNPDVGAVVGLSPADRGGDLRRRLEATKTVRRLDLPGKADARALAAAVLERHRPGTRTIAVVNTVDRAVALAEALAKLAADVPRVLVHSRFRPGDRQVAVDRATAEVDENGRGLIVVTTQVLEAGVDVTSTTLVTELAPWPSIVQRAGRCNRDGQADGAALWWFPPSQPAPYDPVELDAAAHALGDLDGLSASPDSLAGVVVPAKDPLHPVLRRHDLLELLDTLPDLSGNDVDVARFIRESDDMDAYVAWRQLGGTAPEARTPLPGRDERCPVPVCDLRDERKTGLGQRSVWRYDHLVERWVRCGRDDLRPGQVLIFDAAAGGYLPHRGWSPASTALVEPPARVGEGLALTEGDTATGADPVSYTTTRQWVSLERHLGDVEVEVERLIAELRPALPSTFLAAAVLAGRYHDIGKAHEVFQHTLVRSAADDDERATAEREPTPWAKSGGTLRPSHGRRHFRHELASALALLASECRALDEAAEPDLVVYLVAAHHGRVRLGFRSLPGEALPGGDDPDRLFALGVWDGDQLPAVKLPGEELAATRLDLSSMRFGRADDGSPSWTERALALRDRSDLGPFRLGFLEALVRVADWNVSARYDEGSAAT